MLRRVLAFSLIFILLWTSIGYAEGRSWKLSNEEIQQAIKLGKKAKDNWSLFNEWLIGYPLNNKGDVDLNKTYFIISTPFGVLAVMTENKWRKYQELTKEEIEGYLRISEANLVIGVYFLGDKIDFAKDYHCVIKIGDKIIQPTTVENQYVSDKTDSWPSSPAYEALCVYCFPTDDIPRDAIIQVITIGDKEETFTVDLSKIR